MDPYRTLNVPRSADQAAIKQAYRKLAKMLHPDRNPGSARAEQRFKEVSQAYDLLSDPAKRAKYDRGEIDADGRPRHPFKGFEFAGDPQSAAESIFGKMFGGAFGRGFGGGARKPGRGEFRFDDLRREAARAAGARQAQRGADRRYRLEVDFVAAALGGKKRLDHGQRPRGRGQRAGRRRAWQRPAPEGSGRGRDRRPAMPWSRSPSGRTRCSRAKAPMSTSSCRSACRKRCLGASIPVPTIDGPVRITVPAGSNSGRTLRLKGRGIGGPEGRRGDQYVRLLVTLPEAPDAELEQWARRRNYDVRRDREPR